MTNYFEALKFRTAQAPEIITDINRAFVIIGSNGHGMQISQEAEQELIYSLSGVVRLKMEGEGMTEGFRKFHPRSTEMLTIASVGQERLSWLPENDGEDLGQKLFTYGVKAEVMEIFVPSTTMKLHGGIPNGFFEALPRMYEAYKKRFSFVNANHAVETFLKVAAYWMTHRLNPWDLADFSHHFEKFMGSVREFEFWRDDLLGYRANNKGKIAVCCGSYHLPFVQSVLEGKQVERPDWRSNIDTSNDPFIVKNREKLKRIYENLEVALEISI